MSEPPLSSTLKHSLADWTDFDVASHYVAVALGVAPDPGREGDCWGGKKWVFRSANPLGERLYRVLQTLAEYGVLEEDKEEMRFRWNPKYNWETYGAEETNA